MPNIKIEDAPVQYQKYLRVGDIRGGRPNGIIELGRDDLPRAEAQYAADEFFYENSADDYTEFLRYLRANSEYKIRSCHAGPILAESYKKIIHKYFLEFGNEEFGGPGADDEPAVKIVDLFHKCLPFDIQKFAFELLLQGLTSDDAVVRKNSAYTIFRLYARRNYHSDGFAGVSQKLLISLIAPLLKLQIDCHENVRGDISEIIGILAGSRLPRAQKYSIISELLKRLDANNHADTRFAAADTLALILEEGGNIETSLIEKIGYGFLKYIRDDDKKISDRALDVFFYISHSNINAELTEISKSLVLAHY